MKLRSLLICLGILFLTPGTVNAWGQEITPILVKAKFAGEPLPVEQDYLAKEPEIARAFAEEFGRLFGYHTFTTASAAASSEINCEIHREGGFTANMRWRLRIRVMRQGKPAELLFSEILIDRGDDSGKRSVQNLAALESTIVQRFLTLINEGTKLGDMPEKLQRVPLCRGAVREPPRDGVVRVILPIPKNKLTFQSRLLIRALRGGNYVDVHAEVIGVGRLASDAALDVIAVQPHCWVPNNPDPFADRPGQNDPLVIEEVYLTYLAPEVVTVAPAVAWPCRRE